MKVDIILKREDRLN